jgi:hypothetical protein
MKSNRLLVWPLVLAVGVPSSLSAIQIFETDSMKINLNAYVQALGVAEDVPDNTGDRNRDRYYLFLKEARLRFNGEVYGLPFDIMFAPGGEDITPNTNSALGLLDFSFDVPFQQGATPVKVGQFLVPYSRERLTDDATMSFADRSVEDLGFYWNRDYGFALSHYAGKLAGTLAVLSGGGRDVPQRYLPEKLGFPLTVLRVGYNDGIDKDIYHVSARDAGLGSPGSNSELKADLSRPRSAAYFNALFIKDSNIGHSTVINVRATDKNLLTDPNYNPFIARAPFSLATIYQVGGDAVYRRPLGNGMQFNSEGQVDYSHFDNSYGNLDLKGGRLQAGVSKSKWEANIRYSVLWLDERMAYALGGVDYPIIHSKAPIQEITPALTYHYNKGLAVVIDASCLANMVVFHENTIGSYLLSEQPDQVTVVKPGTGAGTGFDTRNNILEARLMVHLGF